MILEEAISNLMNLQVKRAAYSHALTLLYYDGVTAAPRNTAANRGQTTSVLSEQLYALNTSEETVALLEFLDLHREELSEKERRMVFLLLKDIRRMQKIPVEEYTAHKRLLVEAENTWRIAKEKNDFSLFEPYLKRVFDDAKRFAGYCAPEMEPYDYWLNEFEEGVTQAKADVFFATVYRHIVPLLKKVCAAPQLDDSILHGLFSPDKEAALSRRLMEIIGLDSAHVGLAVSEHPFTTSLGSHYDERITTHYREDDFSSALFSVIHEGGTPFTIQAVMIPWSIPCWTEDLPWASTKARADSMKIFWAEAGLSVNFCFLSCRKYFRRRWLAITARSCIRLSIVVCLPVLAGKRMS